MNILSSFIAGYNINSKMNNETILKPFIETIWNKKDTSLLENYLDKEYTIYLDNGDPWEGKTLNHDQFRERLKYSFDSFPDIHFAIQSIISDGDYVVITWILTGTNSGKINNYPPTNKTIKTNGVTIYYFNNEKVTGHSQVFDRTTAMKQLCFI